MSRVWFPDGLLPLAPIAAVVAMGGLLDAAPALQRRVRTPDIAEGGAQMERPGRAAIEGEGGGNPPQPPNILLIVLDDVGYDRMCLFDEAHCGVHTHARTPRLDALAKHGIRFTNFYVNPVCSASRACFQTGRHGFRTGMGALSTAYKLPNQEVTLPELLRYGAPQLTYLCGAFGKWHLGGMNQGHAVNNGFHRFYGSQENLPDHFNWTKIQHDEGGTPQEMPVTTWSASVTRQDAVFWINHDVGPYPFFAYVAFNAPHKPLQMPPWAIQDGRSLLSQETRDEIFSVHQPNQQGGCLPGDGCSDPELLYRAMLEAVDSEIGIMLDDIHPLKLANTMIFVVSDNGTEGTVITGDHPSHPIPGTQDSFAGKFSVYQLGVRVPMIVKGPMVQTPVPQDGHVRDELVGAVDLWRTIAEITGVSESLALANAPNAPATAPCLDSLSFLPLIEDPAGFVARPYAFSQTFTPAGPYDTTMCDPEEPLTNNLRSITKRVDGNLYKYIRYTRFDTLEPPCCPCQYATYDPADNDYVEQFYNVTTDPREIDDLMPQNAQHIDIFDPVLSPILRDLMNEMDSLSGT